MNKALNILIITAVFTLIFLSGCRKDDLIQPDDIIQPLSQKEWTYIFYDDAEFADAYDPFDNFSDLVSSSNEINYIILRDRIDAKAAYYEIGSNHEKKLLKNVGEVDMGDKKTLTDFLTFAKKYFPAKRYITAFYSHGSGWGGCCTDETNDMTNTGTGLTPKRIDEAFKIIGSMDLTLFTGPCLMASLEVVYQERNSSEYYIASEDVSGFVYWLNILDKFDALIKRNPSISTENLSKEIISIIYENRNNNPYGGEKLTMSAVKLSAVSDFVSSFNQVTEYYRNNPDNFLKIMHKDFKKYNIFADVFDLLKVMYEFESDTNAKELLTKAMSCFNECILAECHGNLNQNSNGLNIYYPKQISGSELYCDRNGTGLDFKNDCSWDKLLYSCLSTDTSATSSKLFEYIYKFNGFKPMVKD